MLCILRLVASSKQTKNIETKLIAEYFFLLLNYVQRNRHLNQELVELTRTQFTLFVFSN